MIVQNVAGRDDELLLVIDGLCTEEECKVLIDYANRVKATDEGDMPWHAPGTGGKYDRAIMVRRKMAEVFEKRLKDVIPKILNDHKLLYINDHFRFSRYVAGGEFHVHCDGKNYDNGRPELTDGFSSESFMTLNMPLNTEGDEEYGLVGGGTTFFHGVGHGINKQPGEVRITVPAKAGRAVLFWADQYHQGDLVESGHKYLIRTDVMGQQI